MIEKARFPNLSAIKLIGCGFDIIHDIYIQKHNAFVWKKKNLNILF